MKGLLFILLILLETSCNSKPHKEPGHSISQPSYKNDTPFMNDFTNDQCSCENDSLFMTDFGYYQNKQLIICGNVEEKRSNDTFIVSECLIKNCKDGSDISNHTYDAIVPVILIKQGNTLIVEETRFILNSGDNVDIIPSTEIKIKKLGDSILISPSKKIFSPPKLTSKQNESLKILCKDLKVRIKEGKTEYPGDEKSIYLLYMGALNGNADAKYLFQNLKSLFDLGGGAIEETSEEIWLD